MAKTSGYIGSFLNKLCLPEEEWVDVSGYEGKYMVSNMGRAYSAERMVPNHSGFKRLQKPKIINRKPFKNGYIFVSLRDCENSCRKTLHRLVAGAFIPNPENKPCVNHKNGIKTDNRVENLEWVSYSENSKHAYSIGLAEKSMAKLSRDNVIEARKLKDNGVTAKNIAEKYNVSVYTMYDALRGRTWSDI